MAKTKISEFSSTPANNTDIDSINIAEGCAPSNINDAIRELMAQLKDFQTGAVGDSFNGPIGSSTASTGAFTNITASGTLGVTGVATLGAGAILNTPASVTLTNATGLPISTGVSGLGTGVATALTVNVGSAGAPVVNGGALGTPSSGTVTNLTGTASININGTVGATTPTTGAFTTIAASSSVTLSGGTANGVTYLNGSKVLTSGSALTFDGTNLGNSQNTASPIGLVLNNSSASTSAGTQIFFKYAGSTTTGYILNQFDGSDFNNKYQAAQFHIWLNGANETMRLTSTGLGIGTSSPATKLDVNGIIRGSGTSGSYGESAEAGRFGSTSAAKWLMLGYNTVADAAFIQGVHSTVAWKDIVLQPNAGNLGLGTAPSAWGTSWKAFDFSNRGGLASGFDETDLNNNVYRINTGAYYYKQTAAASTYNQSGGAHIWLTAASGTAGTAITFTQAMTLNASGNLGIGTSSPASKLDVSSASGNNAIISRSTTATNASVQIAGNGNTAGSTSFDLIQDNTYAYVYQRDSKPLVFGTSNTERARIDSSGNLLVGATAAIASERLYVNGSNANYITRTYNSNASPYGVLLSYTGAAPNGTANEFIRCDDTGAVRMAVRSNGGIANYSANNVNLSDQRVKTDIQDAGVYLAKICAIPVRTFKYKDQTDSLLNLGVIAQEVEAVAPELVDTTGFGETPEDGVPLKAIYQTDLQYALMKALQELKAEFDAYKASHP